MVVISDSISIKTQGNDDVIDITDKTQRKVAASKIKNGLATVFVVGSTAGITTIEYEPGLVQDIKTAAERIAPRDIEYKHDMTWHDGNGHAHIRASLMGSSLTVPIIDGELKLGTWQQIIIVDFDTRARSREIILQIIGEK